MGKDLASDLSVWAYVGDIERGRPNLGPDAPVWLYRLMQFSLRDALAAEVGDEQAAALIRAAGDRAGREFCERMLDTALPVSEFLAQLQRVLREQRVAAMRVERLDEATLASTLAVAEDLDCSGLPLLHTMMCSFDEGFIAGIFGKYTGRSFDVREVECWAAGGRVCRFEVRPCG